MAGIQKIMGAAKSAREAVQEATNVSPERVKGLVRDTCHSAYDTIRGSGSIGEEIRRVGKAYVDAPAQVLSAVPRAMGQLLTFQPVELTKTVFGTATNVCKDLAQVCVAPIPAGIAAVEQTLGTCKSAATGLANAPVNAYRTVENGCNRVLNMLESAPTGAPPPPIEGAAPTAQAA